MGFDDLPNFPQGGIGRAESGNQGIPPERFQQALLDQGVRLIADSKRPEDTPAVQEALGASVDALLQQMGHALPPAPSNAPMAPAAPDTQQAASYAPAPADTAARSPEPSGPITPDRIRRALEKYSSPEELAKAYLHTDAARTRAQQDRSHELSSLRSTVETLSQEISSLRTAAQNMQPGQHPGSTPANPTASMTQEEAEDFWRNPAKMKDWMSEVVRDHLMAYTDAQAQHQQEVSFEEYRRQKASEIQALRPFMDEVYQEDRNVFESLNQKTALELLLKRAREREEAVRGRLFYEEMRTMTGGNGAPTPGIPNAAPGTTGSLPNVGSGMSRVHNAQNTPPGGDWSKTRSMDRLWKSRSDSTDEMSAITDILKERGFGEDILIY